MYRNPWVILLLAAAVLAIGWSTMRPQPTAPPPSSPAVPAPR